MATNFTTETMDTIYEVSMNEIKLMLHQGYEAFKTYDDEKYLENAKRAMEGMCVMLAKLMNDEYQYRELRSEALGYLYDIVRGEARERRGEN